jgi:4-amino-4-deoxy-L-arabinose transferase-like glycosyltransferase
VERVAESLPTAVAGSERRSAVMALAAAALVCGVALYGAWRIGASGGYDSVAHLQYAFVVDEQGRLPTEAETYEFASPPAYAWLAVQLHGLTGRWATAQGVSALAAGLLVGIGWLLARELWPARPRLWTAAALLTAGVPIVVRLGTMFHPEALFAALAGAALLLAVRAGRRGFPAWHGAAAGATLGAAALTRQTAVAVAVALGAAVLLSGGRRSLAFLAAALATLALVAGPWWGYQGARFGNPIQSNLDRYILPGGQPREFYVSAPIRDLVVHPYRPAFAGQLWPQFHADLWSDWFGGQHGFWGDRPGAATRAAVSAQSVLGLVFTPFALAGLLVCGIAGIRRRDPAWTASLLLAAASGTAFVVQLVRFPQEGGDPIKASYMLYLAPVFAVAAVAAAGRLWRRSPVGRAGVVAWTVLYAGSYAAFLATSWR